MASPGSYPHCPKGPWGESFSHIRSEPPLVQLSLLVSLTPSSPPCPTGTRVLSPLEPAGLAPVPSLSLQGNCSILHHGGGAELTLSSPQFIYVFATWGGPKKVMVSRHGLMSAVFWELIPFSRLCSCSPAAGSCMAPCVPGSHELLPSLAMLATVARGYGLCICPHSMSQNSCWPVPSACLGLRVAALTLPDGMSIHHTHTLLVSPASLVRLHCITSSKLLIKGFLFVCLF